MHFRCVSVHALTFPMCFEACKAGFFRIGNVWTSCCVNSVYEEMSLFCHMVLSLTPVFSHGHLKAEGKALSQNSPERWRVEQPSAVIQRPIE